MPFMAQYWRPGISLPRAGTTAIGSRRPAVASAPAAFDGPVAPLYISLMKYLYLKFPLRRNHRSGGRHAARLLLLAGASAVAACAGFGDIAPRATLQDVQALDAGSALSTPSPASWPDARWWQAYGDPQLDALVAAALAGNPDLRLARSRIGQAEGYAQAAEAATLPRLDAEAGFQRTFQTQQEFSPSPIFAHTYWKSDLLLRASWTLDLWGKDEKALASALDTVKASEAQAQAARLSLSTAVVQTYVQLSMQHALRDVLAANLERQRQLLDIARRRLGAGLGTELELNQAATPLPDTEAQIEQIDENLTIGRHQLAALTGQGPGAGAAIGRPRLKLDHPAELPAALPAHLLGRRPDIVAQRWRVEASQQDIEVAKARFYPDVNLAAFAGVASLNLSTLVTGSLADIGTAGFGPAISLPLFDGGRLRGNLRLQSARYDEAVERYNGAVIGALREVADEITRLHSIGQQLALNATALERARLAEAQAEQGFHAGLTDYLNVLNTQTALLLQQRNRAQLVARQLESHAALMAALGGGYQTPETPATHASIDGTAR